MSSSSALPPPGNLPSWSRVSALDRSRYPKPFLRDRIPLPPGGGTTITTDAMVDFNASLSNVDVKFLEEMSATDQHRLICYNKSIKFLQQQHADTLKKLHEELDKLKRENKELQFKIITSHGSPQDFITSVETKKPSYSQTAPNDIQTLLLQEEIKDLKQALRESDIKNTQLHQTILSLQNRRDSFNNTRLTDEKDNSGQELYGDSDRVKRHRRKFSVSTLSSPLPLNATLNPLQVKCGLDKGYRVPTMAECESIIQQLHEVNCQQLAELSKLRMDARENMSSRNSTPEPYVLKTIGLADNESFSDSRLPRIPVKPIMKKSIASANSSERVITLPALKNSVTSNVADRRKRQQAVQKARSKKEFQ